MSEAEEMLGEIKGLTADEVKTVRSIVKSHSDAAVLNFASSVQAGLMLFPNASHHRDLAINNLIYKELEKRDITPVHDNRKEVGR